MGRSRSKKRAEERRIQQKKQRNRLIAIGVAAAAIVAVVLVILGTRPVSVDVEGEVLTRYADLPMSMTDRGFPVLGNPDAPADLVEYSSFDCPSCRNFHESVTVNLIDRVRSGEISFTFVPIFGTGSIPNGDDAATAALCAGEQGRFWEYHDLLFDWQGQYVAAAFQQRRLVSGAEVLGLDVEQFTTCQQSDDIAEILDNARAAFNQAEASGTPSVQINNETVASTLLAINTQIDLIMTSAEPVPLVVDEDAEAEAMTDDAEVDEDAEAEAMTDDAEVDEDAEASDDADAEVDVEPEATEEAEADSDVDVSEPDADATDEQDADSEGAS